MPDLIYADASSGLATSRRFRVGLPGATLFGRPVERAEVGAVVDKITGWWDPPPSVGGSTQKPYQDGAWLEEVFYGGRTITLKGTFYSDDHAALRDIFETFSGNLNPKTLFPLVVEELGLIRHAMVRLEGSQSIDWNSLSLARFDLQFFAPDYRKIGGDGTQPIRSVTTQLPAQYGGRVRPNTRPSSINATIITGTVSITNEGTAPAQVDLRINGPVSRPSIQLQDGQLMRFDMDLQVGEWLDIDFNNRTVILNGQASRRGYLRGDWLDFGPGTNVIMFNAGAPSPEASMTVNWSPAWK